MSTPSTTTRKPAPPTTPAAFKRRAEACFKRGNPDAVAAGVSIEWTHGPLRVTWADGTAGFSGIFAATAPGFCSTRMHASFSHDEIAVR